MMQPDDTRLKRFAELVSAYGARPEAWPEAERSWASALLEESPEARRLAADELRLDDWLDSLAVPALPERLEARILAGAPAFARPDNGPAEAPGGVIDALRRLGRRLVPGRLPSFVMRPVYAAVLAAFVGLAMGWSGAFSTGTGEEGELLAMAFVGSGLERYELGDWQ